MYFIKVLILVYLMSLVCSTISSYVILKVKLPIIFIYSLFYYYDHSCIWQKQIQATLFPVAFHFATRTGEKEMAQQTWLCKMLKLRLLSIGSKDFDLSTATPYEQWSPFPPPQYHPLPGFFVGFRFSFSFSVLMSCFSTGMARVLKINICLVAASRLLPF